MGGDAVTGKFKGLLETDGNRIGDVVFDGFEGIFVEGVGIV